MLPGPGSVPPRDDPGGGSDREGGPSRPSRRRDLLGRLRAAVLPRWQSPNLTIVLAARLSMSAARAIAGVVTAIYLAAIGFSALELGILFLTVTAVSAVMSSVIGIVSDRTGRKPFLVAVPLLAAGAAAVYTDVRAPAALFLCAALGSFGRGVGAGGGSVGPYQPAEAALVAEAVPVASRSAAFGRVAFTSTLGALVGGLLAGLARTRPHVPPAVATMDYRPAFVAAAALAALAGILALWLHEPARRQDETGSDRGGPGTRPGRPQRTRVHWPRRSWPALWRLWVANGINGVAIGLLAPFISYWFNRRYGVGVGEIGLLFAVVNAGSLFSTLSAAGIARRLGTVRTIVVARFAAGALLVAMVLAPSFVAAGAIYFVRMLLQRVGLPLRQSWTQDLAHPDERASVAALSVLPAQAAMAGSSALAGLLFEVLLALPFALAGAFQCLNAVAYLVLFGTEERTGSPGASDRSDGGTVGSSDPDRRTAPSAECARGATGVPTPTAPGDVDEAVAGRLASDTEE